MRMQLFILITCINLMACMSTVSTCINDRTIGTILRWGDGDMKSGLYQGYELHAEDVSLYSIKKAQGNEAMTINRVDSVGASVFCSRLGDIIETFTAIQSLYSPGQTYRSIEYINTKTNVHKKAIWNPEFSTFGSKEFRALHDSLMVLVSASTHGILQNNGKK